ncbi:hypothetical protein [Candidatus Enterococcus clewellii]|uniref:Uncharacterized protein n=1 Tax=Candidatus Enterococcus clewellii TaxID=1834193 RepID=A0A242K9P0_9ENTE|nr:hypothetical protein [Enterococcus sp. 9E7_DIV0242]OTP17676.1 hypothetical protein A5888_001814 [Enterococcus sp. 9E7_DIV0242]
MKKKVLGITVGVVILIVAVIGIVLFQKQAAEQKKIAAEKKEITAVQKKVTAIEKMAKRDGELYKDVASLYDEEQDFLAKTIDVEAIDQVKEELSEKQEAIKKLEAEYASKIKTTAANDALKKLQNQAAIAKDKLVIQTDVNALFGSKEAAINGDTVKKELPIETKLTKGNVSKISDLVDNDQKITGEWHQAILVALKNATTQLEQNEKIQKLLKGTFEGDSPKETVKQSDYDTLNEEIKKVKNEELKAGYKAKLVLIKDKIDTKKELAELEKQQQAAELEAEQAAAKAAEDAAAATKKATEDAASQQASAETDVLAGYSAEQIEMARVWLTRFDLQLTGLSVTRYAAGTPINPYNTSNSMTYPSETIMLSGEGTAGAYIVYASNHNGTVTVYTVPGHWPAASVSDPKVSMELTQKVLDSAQVIGVPEGNPNDVRDLILLQR